MQFRKLGQTDLDVSLICLGTMTYGEQNTEAEAHEQLDYAVSQGINFIDTAEMYPVPPKPDTQGRTEAYIGSWLAQRSDRDKLVIASKVAGPRMEHIRGGSRLSRQHVIEACDASLKRLKTDYIDLYQIHWPERATNFFGRLDYQHQAEHEHIALQETLEALNELVQAGKVRYIGNSNETPWGTMHALQLAERHNLPRLQSIQNPYSLLNRSFEVGNAEVAHREQVGLLAYSPLAFGMLTGKYRNGAQPEKGRLTLYSRFQRYSGELGVKMTEAYSQLAERHGLTPTQLALAFVNSRPFVTSNIIGATTMAQLQENIASVNVNLSAELLAEIDALHQSQPNPCP
ncbi:NADP(H)-dependent aldo-keto reductase [Salinibius halmophilus]|uniref:NADP(H)-dependent aldo-keto reductase n=1 Tax=Salinibius halmophilus TaxID=1853216 RepID=UPI000E667B03|nr:NADP(H)-dependent aldo-keto reductase [Salinibius halmophilus]